MGWKEKEDWNDTKSGMLGNVLLGVALFLLLIALFGEDSMPEGGNVQIIGGQALTRTAAKATATPKLITKATVPVTATETPTTTPETTPELVLLAMLEVATEATASPTAVSATTEPPEITEAPTVTPPEATAQPTDTTEPVTDEADSVLMYITFAATCVDANHVGQKWTQAYSVNGESVENAAAILLSPGETVLLRAVITENDKRPDVGEDVTTIALTQEELQTGVTVEKTVMVAENSGRYAGCEAEWRVIYVIAPMP